MRPIKLIAIALLLGSLSSLGWSNLPFAVPISVTATLLPNTLVFTHGRTI